MDQYFASRFAPPDGHQQGLQNKVRVLATVCCPTDHTAGIQVNHNRQIQESFPGLDIGDVGDPEPTIRSLLSEIRLIPEDDTLVIELVGELAGLLALQETGKAKTRGVASGRSIEMVAGVGFEPTTFRL